MQHILKLKLLLLLYQLRCRPVHVLVALELVLISLEKTLELLIIIAIHKLCYTLVAHWPKWLLILRFYDLDRIPQTAIKFIETVLKLLLVFFTLLFHVLHLGCMVIVQIHRFDRSHYFLLLVHIHYVLLMKIVFSLRNSLYQILEWMLTQPPLVLRLKVLSDAFVRSIGSFLLKCAPY